MRVVVSHKKKLLLISVLVITWLINIQLGIAEVSLHIPDYIPGAKAMGMGNAYTSLCDDISSVYYNPSGLASLYHTELYWTYEKLPFTSVSWLAGLGFHYQNLGSFGFAVNYLGHNNILKTNVSKGLLNIYSSSPLLLMVVFGQHFK